MTFNKKSKFIFDCLGIWEIKIPLIQYQYEQCKLNSFQVTAMNVK